MKDTFSSTVTTYSRLHLGLHDCGYATRRVFGGSGVAFKGFPTTVTACLSKELVIRFSKTVSPSKRTIESVRALADRLLPVFGTFTVDIKEAAPEHMGFGSKTSLLLAITQAVANSHPTIQSSPEAIISLTERGGTSGIGVNAFWHGGLIADGGHRAGDERHFAPSSLRPTKKIAPIVTRVDMPADWTVQLFYDPDFTPIEGDLEKKKFAELMPLPEIENLRAIAALYQGLVPAVLEHDLVQLASSLRTMNEVGMKYHEVAVQTSKTKQFLHSAWDAGLAAGLTSFGPTVFVIGKTQGDHVNQATVIAKQLGLDRLGSFAFDNEGVQL